jgi:hypothetical protein
MFPRATMPRSPRWPLAAGIALLLGNPPAGAEPGGPELDGSVSLAWYAAGDRSDAGIEPADADNRLLERFRLNARNLAPGVELRSMFSVRQWFGGDRDGDSEVRVQQAYLQARGSGGWRGLQLLAGRHWKYGAAATGLLDGATVSFRRGLMHVEGFAGTRDWEDRDEVRWPDFDRSRWIGASLGARVVPWAEVSGGYNVLRRGDEDEREILAGTVDLSPVRPFRVLAQIRFDYVRNYALDQRVRGSFRPDARREVWAEYARRRPELELDSFLARFLDLKDAERDEYRGGVRFAVREVGVQGDLLLVNHNEPAQISPAFAGGDLRELDALSWDTRTRLTWRGQSVGWHHADGYGGARDGLLLALSRRVTPKVRVGFDANAVSYEYGRGETVDEDLATLAAWAEAELDSETWATAQVERLDNPVDDGDLRFLLRLRRGFRIGG